MADVAFGRIPFAEQIAFFRRKLNVLTNSYLDVWAEQHDKSFMVAGANRDALLDDFRTAIDKSIAEGASLEDFRRDFDAIVAKYGWSYNGGRNWRSRVIYETNLRTSYAAGRWQQLQALKQDRPYWLYVHKDGEQHPRPLHQQWGDSKLTLHADDPWWHTHYPPNGWGCQCTVRALSARDLKKLGKDGPDQAPPIDMQTVTIGQRSPGGAREVQTPAGVDPGFGYAPGRSLDPNTSQGFGVLRSVGKMRPINAQLTRLYDAPVEAVDDARYTELSAAAARALNQIEREIVTGTVEYACAIDDAGAVRIAVTGTRDTTDLRPYLPERQLVDLVLTHNHPSGLGVSYDDIATAAYGGVRESRIVTSDFLYRLRPTPSGWPGELVPLVYESYTLRAELEAQIAPFRRQLERLRPRVAQWVIERQCLDRMLYLLSQRFGLRYDVIGKSR